MECQRSAWKVKTMKIKRKYVYCMFSLENKHIYTSKSFESATDLLVAMEETQLNFPENTFETFTIDEVL